MVLRRRRLVSMVVSNVNRISTRGLFAQKRSRGVRWTADSNPAMTGTRAFFTAPGVQRDNW